MSHFYISTNICAVAESDRCSRPRPHPLSLSLSLSPFAQRCRIIAALLLGLQRPAAVCRTSGRGKWENGALPSVSLAQHCQRCSQVRSPHCPSFLSAFVRFAPRYAAPKAVEKQSEPERERRRRRRSREEETTSKQLFGNPHFHFSLSAESKGHQKAGEQKGHRYVCVFVRVCVCVH